MTLNGVIALILRHFTEFNIALEVDYVTVVEAIPTMSAEYPLPLLTKTDPRRSRTVSLRLAELLVLSVINKEHNWNPFTHSHLD